MVAKLINREDFDPVYFLIKDVSKAEEPVDESELSAPKAPRNCEIIYDLIARLRKDIELITTKEEYTHSGMKLKYRCKTCGGIYEETHRMLDSKTISGENRKPCKGCREIDKLQNTETRIWQRTSYFIKERNAKINRYSLKGRFYTRSDKIEISCEKGHTFTLTHKSLHAGSWCKICKMDPSSGFKKIKYPTVRSPKGALRFIIMRLMLHICGGMDLKFPMPGGKYYCLCLECGEACILTEKQIFSRSFLCYNRCVRTKITSIAFFISERGMETGDKLKDISQRAEIDLIEAQTLYEKYRHGNTDLPKPQKRRK
jgi:hypothetical protein